LHSITGWLGAFAAFSASVTWAFASTRYAQLSQQAGAVRVNLLRSLCAAALWLGALAVMEGSSSLHAIDAAHTLLLAGSIVCSYAIGDSVFYAAATRAGVSVALAVATIYPLWAALYGALFHGESFGAWRVLGVIGCVAGIAALLAQTQRAAGAGTPRRAPLGVVLALLTSLFWAGNAVFLKLGAEGLSLYQANAVRFSFGALLLAAQLPFKLGRGRIEEGGDQSAHSLALSRRERGSEERVGMWQLLRRLWLPLLADTGVGSIAFAYGITHTDLALGATLSSLSPLVALPIAATIGGERVTLGKVAAVTVTVGGVVLLVAAPG
jgi:drug/metabolite transporter (DMT)-like permease